MVYVERHCVPLLTLAAATGRRDYRPRLPVSHDYLLRSTGLAVDSQARDIFNSTPMFSQSTKTSTISLTLSNYFIFLFHHFPLLTTIIEFFQFCWRNGLIFVQMTNVTSRTALQWWWNLYKIIKRKTLSYFSLEKKYTIVEVLDGSFVLLNNSSDHCSGSWISYPWAKQNLSVLSGDATWMVAMNQRSKDPIILLSPFSDVGWFLWIKAVKGPLNNYFLLATNKCSQIALVIIWNNNGVVVVGEKQCIIRNLHWVSIW